MRKHQQHGGMKLGEMVKRYLSNISRNVTDLEIIRALVSNVNRCRVVYDMSTYSFILELTMQDYRLMDLFEYPLAASIDVPGNDALGTPVNNFCVKLSFVHQVDNLSKVYRGRNKQAVLPEKAIKESNTQKALFEEFGCLRTTAPFVPDIIAHHILTRTEFNEIFERILSPGHAGHAMGIPVAIDSFAPGVNGVNGNAQEIYEWVNQWFNEDGIRVDVNLMEMLDVERAGPGAFGFNRFQIIHSLRADPVAYGNAAIRMTGQIAAVAGKKVALRDSHGGNGLATPDGSQVYLIDLGGTFYLNNPEDVEKILRYFRIMCGNSILEAAEESKHAKLLVSAMQDKTTKSMLLKRHPSVEDLCGFFEIPFEPASRPAMELGLNKKFHAELTGGFVDFMCVPPTLENVHRTLMLIAFIDFMANRMECEHPYCQCGDVLEVVYPNQSGSYPITIGIHVRTFCDFRTFLKTFSLNSLPPGQTRLNDVVAVIQSIVAPCSSGCAAIRPQQLRPNWQSRQAEARILAQEAEARRLAQEAQTRRKQPDEKRMKNAPAKTAAAKTAATKTAATKTATEKESRDRLIRLSSKSGIAKPPTTSKKSDALAAHQIQSAQQKPQQEEPQQQQNPQQQEPVAVPRSWLSRLSSRLDPRSWFKRKGGTRKHKKRNHRRNATKRRH